MSRKYKFLDPQGLYFISFSVVYWIDIFIRMKYQDIFVDSLKYCQKNKGMIISAWCLMPSHVHIVFRAGNQDPAGTIRDLKSFTSNTLQAAIRNNFSESRRRWLSAMFQKGAARPNQRSRQFWQRNNHPIQLWSARVINQKVNYIHNNPVKAGFVEEAHYWRLSSAIDYSGGKGLLDIEMV